MRFVRGEPEMTMKQNKMIYDIIFNNNYKHAISMSEASRIIAFVLEMRKAREDNNSHFNGQKR